LQFLIFYKNNPNIFPAKLKHVFVILLIILSKGFFAGGRKTIADNILEIVVFL